MRFFLLSCLVCSSVFAEDSDQDVALNKSFLSKKSTAVKETNSNDFSGLTRLYTGGYGGYGAINGAYSSDGQYSQYRFCIGVDAYKIKDWAFSIEAGVQSGNSMPVEMDANLIYQAGGLQPQAILKPFLDLLGVVRWNFIDRWLFLVKGGVAYRQMQLTDRTSSQDSLYKFNGEFQGGLGYQLTKNVRVVGLYQGIYSSSKVGGSVKPNGDMLIHHIPTQQAGLLGVEYTY